MIYLDFLDEQTIIIAARIFFYKKICFVIQHDCCQNATTMQLECNTSCIMSCTVVIVKWRSIGPAISHVNIQL